MARMTQKPFVAVEIHLTLSEHEARALELLASYDHEMLVKLFADSTNSQFESKHRLGIKEFLAAVKCDLPPILHRMDEARAVFDGTKIATSLPKAAE